MNDEIEISAHTTNSDLIASNFWEMWQNYGPHFHILISKEGSDFDVHLLLSKTNKHLRSAIIHSRSHTLIRGIDDDGRACFQLDLYDMHDTLTERIKIDCESFGLNCSFPNWEDHLAQVELHTWVASKKADGAKLKTLHGKFLRADFIPHTYNFPEAIDVDITTCPYPWFEEWMGSEFDNPSMGFFFEAEGGEPIYDKLACYNFNTENLDTIGNVVSGDTNSPVWCATDPAGFSGWIEWEEAYKFHVTTVIRLDTEQAYLYICRPDKMGSPFIVGILWDKKHQEAFFTKMTDALCIDGFKCIKPERLILPDVIGRIPLIGTIYNETDTKLCGEELDARNQLSLSIASTLLTRHCPGSVQ